MVGGGEKTLLNFTSGPCQTVPRSLLVRPSQSQERQPNEAACEAQEAGQLSHPASLRRIGLCCRQPVFSVPALVIGTADRSALPPRSPASFQWAFGSRVRQTPLPPASRPRLWAPRLFPVPVPSPGVSSPAPSIWGMVDKMSTPLSKFCFADRSMG